MMRISELEKGIPLPKGASKIHPLILKNAERAVVGQSFSITLEEGDKLTARGIGCSLARRYRSDDKEFKCREDHPGQLRVWRIK